ncbi:MAG: macro domain-containing protein [Planctomycetia bacterium]|nr:macro domain-containing protein [Planctomycetia bacterium]
MMDVVLTVQIGDITKQPDCEGIVNSANANLRAGSGVCGAIHSAAGPALEAYSQRLAPLEIGCSVPTPGFDLPNWFVIHTRGPRYHFDSDPPNQLASAIETALLAADSVKIVRLAIPAISMGVYAYPPEEAVPILVQSAAFISPRLKHVKEIRFIVVGEKIFQLFQKKIYEPSIASQQMIGASKYDIPPFLRRAPD